MLAKILKKLGLFTRVFLAIGISLVLFSSLVVKNASAQTGINRTINFQGKLVSNPTAINVNNSSYTVVFTIYDNPNAGQGTALWSETQSVTTADGIFRVALGSVTPIPSNVNFNWGGLYLGIKVNADSEMTPRVQLAAVPYAFNAEKVSGLTVQDESGNASTSGTLQVANGKTVKFGNAFDSGSNGLTFSTTGTTTLSFGGSGSLQVVDTSTSQTLTSKIIGSTGLTFTGASTDITTGTNENLVISPNGSGFIGLNTGSPQASIDLRGNPVTGGTLSIASVSGKTSFATLVANNDGVGDIFTASASGATRFVISNQGNVGIGVSSSTTQLQVGGVLGTSVIASISGNLIVMPNGGWGGRVGIGTTDPSAELEVVGDIVSTGTKWTPRTSAADNSWKSVAYGNGMYVAVGDTAGTGNQVMTSPDGVNWTLRTSAADNSWKSVTFGDGMFVAVSTTGTGNRVMTSFDGITWTLRSSAGNNAWQSVAYGNGMFVAVSNTSGTGNQVMTSPNGINWTMRTSASDSQWSSVTYGNGLFVAVSGTSAPSTAIMTSANGISWTARTGANNLWRSVTYGNGLFVAVASGGGIQTSSNGAAWTSQTLPSGSGSPLSVAYGEGMFVLVTNAHPSSSSNGIGWKLRESAAANTWQSVTYGNGLFVAVSDSGTGNRVMTSGKTTLNNYVVNKYLQQGVKITASHIGSGTLEVASISGRTSFAALVVNNDGVGDVFTASASGWTRFTVLNNGTIYSSAYTSAGECLKAQSSGIFTLGVCGGGGVNWWNQIGGAISPSDINYDFLLGANSTVSAKFSVTNMLTGTPLVSTTGNISAAGTTGLTLSGNNAGITFSGTGISQISTASNQNMAINPGEGGVLGINTDGLTPRANVDIRANIGTIAIASVSGRTSYAAFVVDNAGNAGKGDIFTASASGATRFVISQWGMVTIGNSTNGLTFDPDTANTAVYNGTARPTRSIHMYPEYAGAVLTASGSATTNGFMTSDASPSALFRNYYEWSTNQAVLQDYTVAVQVTLPNDFSAWTTTNAITIEFNTATTNATQNKFDLIVYNANAASPTTPVVIRTANVSSVAKTWQTLTIPASALSGWATAGHYGIFYIKMYAASPGYIQIGDIDISYLSRF